MAPDAPDPPCDAQALSTLAGVALARLKDGDESVLTTYLDARDALMLTLAAATPGEAAAGARAIMALDGMVLEEIAAARGRLRAAIHAVVESRRSLEAYRPPAVDTPRIVERLG